MILEFVMSAKNYFVEIAVRLKKVFSILIFYIKI